MHPASASCRWWRPERIFYCSQGQPHRTYRRRYKENLTWFSHRGHMAKCYTESSVMRTANLPVCEASSNSRPTGPMPVIFPCGDYFLREMTQKTKTKKIRASLGRTGPVKPRVAKRKEPVPQIIFFYGNKFRVKTPLIILASIRHAGRELGGEGG